MKNDANKVWVMPRWRRWLLGAMRNRDWIWQAPRNSIRRRVYCLVMDHHPWWDWGHRLMILVGRDFGGNWSAPEHELPTWWYRRVPRKPMWRTGYPRSTFQVVTDYEEFRALTQGLNEDQMYEWQAFNLNQDGELQLGHRYWGGTFYGMRHDELRLLRRYLRMAHRIEWFGLRRWLYSQGLHAAVYRRKPFSCGAKPPKGMGGYDHWLCTLRRGHDGMHRFNNYTWGEIGGEPIGALYNPEDDRRATVEPRGVE